MRGRPCEWAPPPPKPAEAIGWTPLHERILRDGYPQWAIEQDARNLARKAMNADESAGKPTRTD